MILPDIPDPEAHDQADMYNEIQPHWPNWQCELASGSKGKCKISKILSTLLVPVSLEQFFFQERIFP